MNNAKRIIRRPGQDKSPIVAAMPEACANETKAVEFLEARRGWDTKPACAHCGASNVYKMTAANGERSARFLWRCRECKKQYTVRVGTVFEDSRIPLRHWCYGFWAAASSKKGVSSLQVKRQTGLSYKSALFMMHRIRCAMAPSPTTDNRVGGPGCTVEADETYVGGKPRYKGRAKRGQVGRGTVKIPVVACVEREGDVRLQVTGDVNGLTLGRFLISAARPESRLVTDDFKGYNAVGRLFPGGHESVRHSRLEYARGDVHSNTAESVFAIVKRALHGTWHSVSPMHLHRYLAEIAFRWNTRHVDDGERAEAAIQSAVGKRLMYRRPA